MTPGTTLMELIVALAIIAVVAAITMPGVGAMIDRARVSSAVTEGVTVFGVARHLAIRRARRTTVAIDTATATLLVLLGTDTAHRRPLGATHGVTLRTTRDSMSYHPTGIGYGSANLSLIVARRRAADTIVISRLGRVRH